MTKKIVRLGDASDHGGVMITATGGFTVDGVQGCVQGDQHQCPIKGHGVTSVTSSSEHTAMGKPIIRTDDVAGCGAKLIGQGSTTAT